MLEALWRYYAAKKILSTKFFCPHETECRNGNSAFAGPASAFVSTGYERRTLPRLLILSPDSGKRDPAKKKEGLPLNMREWGEGVKIMNSHGSKHWFRTHELAWYILRRFDPQLRLEDVNKHIAHTNAAKCCENNPGGRLARGTLFDNCREFLPGELEILSPDILVTQGEQAKETILRLPDSYEISGIDQYSHKGAVSGMNADDGNEAWHDTYASSEYLRRLRYPAGYREHDVLWLRTWHPTSGPTGPMHDRQPSHFSRQIDLDPKIKKKGHPDRCRGWSRYADIIADWWKQEYGDLRP